MVKDKAFDVPKALLCYNSKYFERETNKEITDVYGIGLGISEYKIKLKMATEEGFELVLQWSKYP